MSSNTSTINRSYQILQSTISCTFTSVLIFFLFYYKRLYNIGKYSSLSLVASSVLVECLKVYLTSDTQNGKNNKSKKPSWKNKLKCGAVIGSMIIIYYVTAVCLGAAFMSKQEETLMFSILLTALTAVPLCLQLGADSAITVLMELTTQDNFNENFKHNVCLTWFGAWLGAIVIPLDWDRPWQIWPIPCCLGALIGYTLSHAFILLKCMPNFEKVLNKKPVLQREKGLKSSISTTSDMDNLEDWPSTKNYQYRMTQNQVSTAHTVQAFPKYNQSKYSTASIIRTHFNLDTPVIRTLYIFYLCNPVVFFVAVSN